MARPINRLSARAVVSATTPGYVADGGGLYLQISPSGTKAWVFRYERAGRRREMGLGSAAIVSLQEARSIALQQRLVLVSGKDPLEERRLLRSVAKPRTWGDCVDAYIDSHRAGWKNEAQADQWEQSLREYGPRRAAPVASIDTGAVMDSPPSLSLRPTPAEDDRKRNVRYRPEADVPLSGQSISKDEHEIAGDTEQKGNPNAARVARG